MDLLQEALAGNDDVFEDLFRLYRPVIYAIRNRYYLRDFEFEDWLQEGRICMFTSLQSYDDSLGVTFGTYFKSVFKNHIKDELRKQNAVKRQSLVGTISIDQYSLYNSYDFMDRSITVTPRVVDQLMVEEVLADFPQILSGLELDAFTAYVEGSDLDKVAAEHGVTCNRVKFAFQRSRRKLLQELSFSH